MAKRRTAEQILLDNLMEMPANRWFGIRKKVYDKFDESIWHWELEPVTVARVEIIKSFIDRSEPFEFSSDYKKIKRMSDEWVHMPYSKMFELPADIRCIKIEDGETEVINIKGTSVVVDVPPHYKIFFNDKLIAIEK